LSLNEFILNKSEEILNKYWGYNCFRPLQLDIINSIIKGNDTLGLMPTGGGKSITFQVPTMQMNGICLVVTPLIALMKDQVENLQNKNISAKAIYTGLSHKEISNTINQCIYGDVKFLYISPERLGSSPFLNKLGQMNICLLAIDEAHCISQWGYDFRPSYLKISEVRNLFPKVPILALTATATIDVVEDIQERLAFRTKNVFRKSFERSNLTYVVRNAQDKDKQLLRILGKTTGTAIVYVRSRRKTKEIADFLNMHNLNATYYHAGLSYIERNRRQELWMADRSRIIVATNAFGMGIDKPDVRLVVHFDLPDNIEAYFQEAGRAGRDEKNAYAVLLYNSSDDKKLKKRLADTYPDKETIINTYEALSNYLQLAEGEGEGHSFVFDMRKFARNFKLNIIQAYSSLRILQRCGYIELTDEVNNPTRIMFNVNRDSLYSYDSCDAKHEEIIKLLLRTYSGLFVSFVGIDDELIAEKVSISKEKLYEYLVLMSKQKVLSFIPRVKTPYVFFVEPRLPKSYIKLSNDVYKNRKQRFKDKLEHMRYYASSSHKCRSAILVEYFGENDVLDCGKCDVCLDKKRNKKSLNDEKSIKDNVLKRIVEEPIHPEKLVDSIDEQTDYVINAITYLLEEEKVYYNSEGLLCVNKE